MDIKEFIRKKSVISLLIAIGTLLILLAIFQAGMFVGFRKAAFSYSMGNNYYARTFDAPRDGVFQEGLSNAYGAAGEIISITPPTFIVNDHGAEKTVRIGNGTQIRRSRDTLATGDIKTGDFVIVVGEPNEGAEIEATLIRLLPPPPGMMQSTTTP